MVGKLDIKARRHEDSCVLSLEGVVNFYTCSELLRELSRSNPRAGKTIAINLAGVEYIDSASIGSLVTLAIQAQKSSVHLILACLRKDVARILRLSGVLQLFKTINATEFATRFQLD